MKPLKSIATVKLLSDEDVASDPCIWIRQEGEHTVSKERGNAKHMLQVIPGHDILLDFLFEVIQRPLENLIKGDDKIVKKLTIVALNSLEIPVPSIEEQKKILKSKNLHRRMQKLWLENGIRSYEPPLKINMTFDELLKLLATPKSEK